MPIASRNRLPLIIKGAYGCGNFGDDALMTAVHRMARTVFAADDIGYLCNPADYIREALLPEARVLLLSRRKALSVGTLLFGGGTQFFSFPLTRSEGATLSRRAAALVRQPHQLPLRIGRKLIRPGYKMLPDRYENLAAVGVGVGPFVDGSPEERSARDLFLRMDYVAVRDVGSHELCKQWGVRNPHHYADLCFWPGFYRAAIPDGLPGESRSVKHIGLIVRDWPHDRRGDSYEAAVFAVADRLAQAGKRVDFILLAGKQDAVWRKRLARRTFTTLSWDPQGESIGGFLRRLAHYDLFITARYHGAVFATVLGKPSICIDIEPKLSMFAELLSGAGRCWQYPFCADACVQLAEEMEKDYPNACQGARNVLQQQSRLAEKMVAEFLDFAGR